jgi:hypothetical protein
MAANTTHNYTAGAPSPADQEIKMTYSEVTTNQGSYLTLGETLTVRGNAVAILYTTTPAGATVISDETANALEESIGGFNAPWAMNADNYADYVAIYNANNYLIHYYETYASEITGED